MIEAHILSNQDDLNAQAMFFPLKRRVVMYSVWYLKYINNSFNPGPRKPLQFSYISLPAVLPLPGNINILGNM